MYQDPYLTHRVIALEAERAARRLEQRRMIAENSGRIVRRPGLLARLARAAASQRQAVAEPACPAGSRCAVADA